MGEIQDGIANCLGIVETRHHSDGDDVSRRNAAMSDEEVNLLETGTFIHVIRMIADQSDTRHH